MVMSKENPSETADLSLPSLTHILIATSRHTGLTIAEIKAQRRQRGNHPANVQARRYVVYVAREHSKRPWGIIARYLDRNRDSIISMHGLAAALVRRGDADMIAATGAISRMAWQLHEAAQDSVRVSA